jgi:predicted SAM-dependent methyltransferase
MWLLGEEMDIAAKRNLIAQSALNMGAKYVMYLGDDTIPPKHAFVHMLRVARLKNIGILTGLYMSRSHPPQPMIWKDYMQGPYYDWHLGDLFEIDWAGCDIMLVDTEVFKKVPEPWFSLDYVFEKGQEKPISLATEDIYFYHKARQHGFPAWCDTAVHAIHQDRNTGEQFYMPASWPQAVPGSVLAAKGQDYLVADLGCGRSSDYVADGKTIRFDIDPAVKPDVLCDIRVLPEPDKHYDEVHCSHILEHFPAGQAPDLIKEWCRILKIGGKLKITVPNFELAITKILEGPPAVTEYNWWQVYGRHDSEHDVHHNGFTVRALEQLLTTAWGHVHGETDEGNGCLTDIAVEVAGEQQENLVATATKIRHPVPTVIGPGGEFSSGDERDPTPLEAAGGFANKMATGVVALGKQGGDDHGSS